MSRQAMQAPSALRNEDWQLAVTLHRDEHSPEVGRELVHADDLVDVRSEAWLNGILRKGHPTLPFEAAPVRVEPVRATDGNRCVGFALATLTPGGIETRHEFSVRSLHPVATRAAQRLMQVGILQPGELYYYELVAQPTEPAAAERTSTPPALGMKFEKQIQPVHALSVPLDAIRRDAASVGPVDERAYPVFYTEATLEKAERYARAGVAYPQPVETGAVLLGSLCSCPDSGEMFVVITDALEAADTEQIVRAMQQRPEARAQRIVGQCHGHNFLPLDGAPPCENCDKIEVCGRTTVFVSADDFDWNRAVFTQQPWQLCHIFGLNARQENVHGLFGLRDGRLLERGYSVIPSFEPRDFVDMGESAPLKAHQSE
jgi:hypothetical protein